MRARTAIASAPPLGGFTLIEVLVAIVLVSIAMLGLAPVTLRVAQMTTQFTVVSQRTAVLAGEVNRIAAQDFSTLAAGTTCQTISTGVVPQTQCTRVTDVNSETKQITVIVTPQSRGPADTTVIERSERAASPLNRQ